jgi:hypothetical protein
MRTPIRSPEAKGWESYLQELAQRLFDQTGQDLKAWNARVLAEGPGDEAGLRAWLAGRGVTGYPANLLVRERFGYPEWFTASAQELIDGQYADRTALRPIFEAIIEAANGVGEVVVQPRKTYVSLLTPKRTFARIQATTRTRVDLALRFDSGLVGGRLQPSRIHENTPVQLSFAQAEEVDEEAIAWLARAWRENC